MTKEQEIFKIFSELDNPKEAKAFLKDILTEKELNEVESRWELIKKLADGKTQRQVRDEVGVSIATVTHGAKVFRNSKGGFTKMLEKVKDIEHTNTNLENIRSQIDEIDDKILSLLGDRMQLMPFVAQFKRDHEIKLIQKDREESSISRKKEKAKKLGINSDFVDSFFSSIFNESKKLQIPKLISHDLKEIKKIANKNKKAILPIFIKIKTDTETPISLYKRMTNDDPYSFILESVGQDNVFSRYSFIGTKPKKTISFNNGIAKIKDFEKNKEETRLIASEQKDKSFKDPLDILRKEMGNRKLIESSSLPRFSGGALGFLGYDCIKYFEKTVTTPKKDNLNIPEAMYGIYDKITIFDHIDRIITFVVLLELEGDLEKKFSEVTGYFSKVLFSLEEPIKLDPLSTNIKKDEVAFHSNYSKKEFTDLVKKLKKNIVDGEIFQIVLSQQFQAKIDLNTFDLYRSLRQVNPSFYLFYLKYPEFSIIGASPETFVQVEDGKINMRALAGTIKRGKTEKEDKKLSKELLSDEKECAEHLMLVDLARNDVGKVSKTGTVKVKNLMHISKNPYVMHIASDIQGEINPKLDALDVLKSCFPRGTLSGAPKVRAMELISKHEKQKRSIYGGAVHYLDYSGNLDAAICIRTMLYKDKTVYVQAGCGVVYDSVPESEYEETKNKAKGVLKAVEKAQQYGINNYE